MRLSSSSSFLLATLAVSSSSSSMAAPAEHPSSLQQSSLPSSPSVRSVAMAAREDRMDVDVGEGHDQAYPGVEVHTHSNRGQIEDLVDGILVGLPLGGLDKTLEDTLNPLLAILPRRETVGAVQQAANAAGSTVKDLGRFAHQIGARADADSGDGASSSSATTSGLASTSAPFNTAYTSFGAANSTSSTPLQPTATSTGSSAELTSTTTSTYTRRSLRFLREDAQMTPSSSTYSISPSDTSSASVYSTSTDAASSTFLTYSASADSTSFTPSSTDSMGYAPTVLVRAASDQPSSSSSVDSTSMSASGANSASPTSTQPSSSVNSTSSASPTLPANPPNTPVGTPKPSVPEGASQPSAPVQRNAPPMFPGMKAVDPSASSATDVPSMTPTGSCTMSTTDVSAAPTSSTMAGYMPADTAATASDAGPTSTF
ncbi:hypothetical protein K466DRAFT_663390 [Polyporus arcularius HHB13444]|uniref:REJ domain-containing protein n=1 Tax=Polyporus arcularius HHB13444 TaxID=1314778 RepID=A0A5C3PFC1_9APHY|nr:hypothetical protein K466DRAFT_663390 [Polyporus arcularius HHB13444]